jgi:hypothetical protein
VSYCPEPSNPDFHICFICQNPAIDHHHSENRGSGGSKRDIPVVALCRACHTKITLYEWTDKVLTILGKTYYVAWDVRGKKLCERELSDAQSPNQERELGLGEGVVRSDDAVRELGVDTGTDSGPRLPRVPVLSPEPGGVDTEPQESNQATASDVELTRSECIARARALREERERNPWNVGELLNAAEALDEPDNSWDPVTGESLLDVLGIQPETASQYQNLCRLFPPPRLASMGHAQACAKQPDREEWMKLSAMENLSVAELRRRIRGDVERVKVKRWSRDELMDGLKAWQAAQPHLWCTCGGVFGFLDWLSEVE